MGKIIKDRVFGDDGEGRADLQISIICPKDYLPVTPLKFEANFCSVSA
jgi:hypothetical protein